VRQHTWRRIISGLWNKYLFRSPVVFIGIAGTFIFYVVSVHLSQGSLFVKDIEITPPGFSEIEDRGLDVVAAFMDRKGSITIREAGGLRSDGVAPEDTLVDIGSITKFVTAVAILKLAEQDRLDLDEPLDSIWTNAPDDKASITVEELLTHTSGLTEEVGRDKEQLSRREFVDRVFASDLDEDRVGEYHYSNAGYGLLAAIVERRSGKSFDSFIEEDLLAPAGLGPISYERAYRNERSLRTSRSWATTFTRQTVREASWGGDAPGWNLVGNGGLVTTPLAYLRFWSAVRDGRVIDTSLLREALRSHVDAGQEEGFYGYGIMVNDMPGHGTVYGHDGENEVFSAEWRDLSERGLVIFTAGRGQDAFRAMKLILRALDDEEMS